MKIKLNLIYILILISFLVRSQSLSKYSHIKESHTNCEISKMIVNVMNENKDWPTLISQYYNDYYKIINGTKAKFELESINQKTLKQAMNNTFPAFYNEMFSYSMCKSISDRKLLIIIFYNANGFYLSDEDKQYLSKNFNDTIEDNLYKNMRDYRYINLEAYTTKLIEEYKSLLK